jgi:hypothetical protein
MIDDLDDDRLVGRSLSVAVRRIHPRVLQIKEGVGVA